MPRNRPYDKSKPTIQYLEFKEARLNTPKLPEIYKLKRVYWLLMNMHRLLEKDPTAVPTKSYLELLDLYTKLVENAQKKGLDTAEGRKNARYGMDSRTVAKEVQESDSETDDGFQEPFSMGA